jgi:hypothetical protein
MATTTPNFGWAVPTSTDLVKDGAVAIETLGDSIDASLVDLKGGTTGQVLSKASGTDMDFSWVAQDDSNAIQNAIVDAKGDIIAATANDTPARLAVGANNTVLTADSSTATGLKWATPSSGTPAFVGCQAINDNFSVSYTQYTNLAIPFASADRFDSNGFHDPATNNTRITIPTGYTGKYLITFTGFLGTQNTYANAQPYINGATYKDYYSLQFYTSFSGTANGRFAGTVLMNLNAGDYVEVYYSSDKATGTISGAYATFGCIFLGA